VETKEVAEAAVHALEIDVVVAADLTGVLEAEEEPIEAVAADVLALAEEAADPVVEDRQLVEAQVDQVEKQVKGQDPQVKKTKNLDEIVIICHA